MNRLLVYTLLVIFIKASNTIRCFKCAQEKSNYVSEQDSTKLCQYFNGNNSYAFDCPYSTMCVLEHITLDMGNGFKSEATQRYCAHQTETGEQEYVDGVGWRPIKPIHEVYKEGCATEDNGQKTTTTRRCYCREDLCNGFVAGINSSSYTFISVINLSVCMLIVYVYR